MNKRWMPLLGGLLLALSQSIAWASDFGGVSTSTGLDAKPLPPDCAKGTCCTPDNNSPDGFDGQMVGDPVWVLDGSLHLSYTDLDIGSVYPIRLTRRFDSRSTFDTALGYGWAFDFDRRLFEYPDGSVMLRSGCGRQDSFVFTGGAYTTASGGMPGQLTEHADGTFTFRYTDGRVDRYDADGRLVSIISRTGESHELSYDPAGRLPLVGTSPRSVDPNRPMVVAYQPRLKRIEERRADGTPTGHAVDFYYDSDTGRLTHIIASDGRRIDYTHDTLETATRGNLEGVSGLQDLQQVFAYGDPNDAHKITGIQNGDGAQIVVNTFDANGRVLAQVDGNSTLEFSYPNAGKTEVTRIVRTAAGAELSRAETQYEFVGADLIKETNGEGHEVRFTYSPSRDLERKELWQKLGTTLSLHSATSYTYDGQGRRLTETVEVGGGEAVTTTWTYDSGWVASEQVVSSAAPSQVFRTEYTFVRDGQGVPAAIASEIRRSGDGADAITTYSYCSTADVGNPAARCPDIRLRKLADGPRTDVQDITRYEYFTTTDLSGCGTAAGACYRKGDLSRVINALDQAVEYLKYDATGHAVKFRDANGVVTDLVYHPRGWLLERTVRGSDDSGTSDDAITRIRYDARGNPERLNAPDGAYATFVYNGRNELTEVRDGDGNSLVYTLDSEGNVLKEETFDAGGTLKHQLSHVYDVLGRLAQLANAQGDATSFAYDGAARPTLITDARGIKTSQTYDALGRLVQTLADTDGIRAETRSTYNAKGQVTKFTDPKGLDTTYAYDRLGQLTRLVSPDTGTTTFEYDSSGNRIGQTDARGVDSGYQYDVLNRLTTITLPTTSQDVVFTYDNAPADCISGETFSAGRLTRMSDESGETRYCYERHGHIARKVQAMADGPTLTIAYARTTAGRLQTMTYPSGATVTYQRDTNGRISGIVAQPTAGAAPVTLVESASYLPFGPLTQLRFGNGRSLGKQYDQNYAIDRVADSAGGIELDYTIDKVGNVVGLSERSQNGAVAVRTVDYDNLGRLTGLRDGATPVETLTYDATGNRTSKTRGSSQPYSYPADSHKLGAVGTETRSYDAAGNTKQIGGRTLQYSDRGRLREVSTSAVLEARYRYNGKGERVRKEVLLNASASRLFVYDESGRLLGEYDFAGNRAKEYVWLDDTLVAVLGSHAGGDHQYVLTDHLGTPRAVVNPSTNAIVWRWDIANSAFGNHVAQEDVDGDGIAYELNLRFPGQYFDAESGLHYNYFRDYEPASGRYIESDPIGLWGGMSTYGYAFESPVGYFDPVGMQARPTSTGRRSGNYSPGGGGDAHGRRKETRRHLRSGGSLPPPSLPKPIPYEEATPDGTASNPRNRSEVICDTVNNAGLDVCGPGSRYVWNCLSSLCRKPTNQCTINNPTGSQWVDPEPTMSALGSSDPNCRCDIGYFDER